MKQYPMTQEDAARLENNFRYHPPIPELSQAARYEAIREFAKGLAYQMMFNAPRSRELSAALTHLEDAVMWCNAAIARNETPPAEPPAA